MADEKTIRRERKDVRRNLQRVLEAAQLLFAERGSNVTMEEVARHAGVGVGTVYRRFTSKEQLFAAISRAACSDARACLVEAAEVERDPIAKLRALVQIHYRRTAQQAALLDLDSGYLRERQSCSHAEQQRLYSGLQHLLEHIIAEGQQRGIFRPGDPRILAAICVDLLTPRSFQHLQRVAGGSPDDVAEHVVQFVVEGLRVRT